MNKLDIIKSFEKKKILLIGDAILDVYYYGKQACQALDAPVIEAEETNNTISFGGASSVASNLLELGASVIYFSVVGNDKSAQHYNHFNHPKLNKKFLVDKNRKTTVKKSFWIDGLKALQINQVTNRDIDGNLEKKLIKLIKPFISQVDVMLILDAQHGLLTKNLITQIISLTKKYQKPLYVDSQIAHRGSNHHLYKGADCVFFSESEARAVDSGFDVNSIKEKLGIVNAVVKLGERGSMASFDNQYIESPPHQVKTVDTCGAGDAFLAAFSLSDRDFPEESLVIANIWAALSTTIQGAIPPKKQDLINICHD